MLEKTICFQISVSVMMAAKRGLTVVMLLACHGTRARGKIVTIPQYRQQGWIGTTGVNWDIG